jgi:hypothetical protein
VDRTAKLIAGAIAAILVLALVIAGYPAVVFGTEADDLAASLSSEGADTGGDAYFSCAPARRVDWRCGDYNVDVNWRGCWTAAASPDSKLSGCIGLSDHLGFNDPVFGGPAD